MSSKNNSENNLIIHRWRFFMEKNQKINCTVTSCKHNNTQEQECKLEQIIVTPIIGCDTKQADESMCSSYYKKQNN